MATGFFSLLVASLFASALPALWYGNCKPPPEWKVKNLDPMAEARSKSHVVLLGIMIGS